jgi:hypothetical protein
MAGGIRSVEPVEKRLLGLDHDERFSVSIYPPALTRRGVHNDGAGHRLLESR